MSMTFYLFFIQGVCFNEDVDIWQYYNIPKVYAVLIAACIHAFILFVFYVSISWVQIQQNKDILDHESQQCRINNYSVSLENVNIPVVQGLETLRSELKAYLEESLNKIWPVIVPGEVRIADINFCLGSPFYFAKATSRAGIFIN